jgi:hypothetical protein
MLNQSRECDYFRLWLPGKSPKEHEDMGIVETVTQQYRLAQESSAAAAREAAQAAAQTAERRHADTLVEARKYRLVSLLAALAALASVALSLWALLKK